MIVTYSDGNRTTYAKNIGSTALVALVSAVNAVKTVESINISCGGTTANFSLIFDDGTTDFYIMHNEVLAVNTSIKITDQHFQLKIGQSLKVQASVADQISVVAVMIDTPPQKSTSQNSGGAPQGAMR